MSKRYAGLIALKDATMSFDDVLLYYSDIPLPYFIMKTAKEKKEGKIMSRIINHALTDLRNFSPEALKKIKSMTNVALVLLPENPTPEFSEAYASIRKTNVASELNSSSDVCVFNGMSILDKNNIADNSLIVCNGLAVIKNIPKEKNIKVIVNGMLIKSSSAFMDIIKINGAIGIIDDEARIVKSNSTLTIDENFINNLSDKTAIINCGKIYIENEVSEAMLQSKGVVFYDTLQIFASKELHGYIQANSYNVKNICAAEEAKKRSKAKERFFRWK
ncbi:MAG: hypothetical protein IKJ27_03590 [Clostridia bacterium]|nr:hypothetical protein [Clostridia bacterium]